jgi:hypothetical protein
MPLFAAAELVCLFRNLDVALAQRLSPDGNILVAIEVTDTETRSADVTEQKVGLCCCWSVMDDCLIEPCWLCVYAAAQVNQY